MVYGYTEKYYHGNQENLQGGGTLADIGLSFMYHGHH